MTEAGLNASGARERRCATVALLLLVELEVDFCLPPLEVTTSSNATAPPTATTASSAVKARAGRPPARRLGDQPV